MGAENDIGLDGIEQRGVIDMRHALVAIVDQELHVRRRTASNGEDSSGVRSWRQSKQVP